MRFLRQLAAVTAVVTIVVLIGLAWYHLAPGSLGGQGRGGAQFVVRGRVVMGRPAAGQPLPGAKVTPGIHLSSGRSVVPPIQLGDLLQPANLVVLRTTAEIEAAAIAAVVIIDAGLRKRRRARRAPD